MPHHLYLQQVSNAATDDALVLAWRSAVDNLTEAVKTRTEKTEIYAESTYVRFMEETIKEM